MFTYLRTLRERWSNWTGDKDLENAIRKHLTSHGYFGGSAKLQNVRLAAVQRPGWQQIYRFDAIAKLKPLSEDDSEAEAEFQTLFGLVREDARHNQTIVRAFVIPEERRELFEQWSVAMIQKWR